MRIAYRSDNELWGRVLANTLAALGVQYAVIAPGSRSTPLVLGLTEQTGIRCIPVLDERSAGFLALGMAKGTGKPVVVLTTSGTAAANLLPAVVEARESRVPLLVLTADRPPELRECQSGQTIDQVKLYGNYPLHYQETMLPEATSAAVACLRQVLVHAWQVAIGRSAGTGGPCHLNIPLRDPLTPSEKKIPDQLEWMLPPQGLQGGLREEGNTFVLEADSLPNRGLILAGVAVWTDARKTALWNLARGTGWPVLVDALSGLREETPEDVVCIAYYDLILRNDTVAGRLAPAQVIQIGGLPTSKVLRQRLQEWQPELWVVDPAGRNLNSLHLPGRTLPVGVDSLTIRGNSVKTRNVSADFLNVWIQSEKWACAKLTESLQAEPAFEGRWVRELEQVAAEDWFQDKRLDARIPLLIGNSMPVRDWEYFHRFVDSPLSTFCNRGANGIDGVLSTAVGLAEAQGQAILVTGDLGLLHDTNGFLLHRRMRGELLILLIDNGGGGIFRHLPIGQINPPFEEFFLTPQYVEWQSLANAYGIEMVDLPQQENWGRFLRFTGRDGIRILRWNTDSSRDSQWRMRTFRELASQLSD